MTCSPSTRWISGLALPSSHASAMEKHTLGGVSDDKGNLVSRILAVKTLLEVLGEAARKCQVSI